LPDEEQIAMKWQYILKNLAPNILAQTPGKIIKSTKTDEYGREGNTGQVLLGELTGIKITRDVSAVRSVILTSVRQQKSKAITALNKKKKRGEISQEEYQKKKARIIEDFKKKIKSY
jgi:hypothetical protein